MYWPIGPPKVYSLSKRATANAKTTYSEDGSGESVRGHTSVVLQSNGNGESGAGSTGNTRSPTSSAEELANVLVENGGANSDGSDDEILAAKVSRSGSIFATITRTGLTVWQSKPTVALAAVIRSRQSLEAYGSNSALLLRPDALIIVVQTGKGYLITYSLATDPQALIYRSQLPENVRHARKNSVDGYRSYLKPDVINAGASPGEGDGLREVNLRFRMVIRIDAGISEALALDDELVVATQKPAALQCIRWVAEEGKSQTSTELLSKMPWFTSKATIVEMVHDRPMNMTCWATSDGKAYAVQKRAAGFNIDGPRSLFQGFCFRDPEEGVAHAAKLAINARFSLIAVGLSDGSIEAYVVKDYAGNIPISHNYGLSTAAAARGELTHLMYSPDGYCLFAGYERGWTMWSVYGKPMASSFATDRTLSESNDERWLHGIRDAFWVGAGSELAVLCNNDDRLWTMNIARHAATGCLSPTNIARGLLHADTSITLYKGQDIPDLTSLSSDAPLWQTVQIPNSYLVHQWPIKLAVTSADSKYVAVAGKRGLAHYSVSSGRWKTFDDPAAEQEFAVRGGMCWHRHFLIAAVEGANSYYQVRIYSREKSLGRPIHIEDLSAPALLCTMSGSDSLLVYTYDNILLHYIITASGSSAKLVQVGQIGFHGIIRAPPRVRAISWVLPEHQLEHGDPSQDVATASVLFLVDGKLVLLQPSTNEYGELKYDMRVIAQNVEYFLLLRDQPSTLAALKAPKEANGTPDGLLAGALGHSLRDSLWYFDGDCYHVWSDVQDVLACAPAELGRELPPTVRVPMDFYPVSAMVAKGVVHGLDSELVQRRDVNFSFYRHSTRTQLFLPHLLRYHLAEYNSPAALHLASSYQHLPYFAHALEILLHDVLDTEVDNPPKPPETALLPTVISFLSSFPAYLDIIVNCTRKTELRSWRTLFSCLPPVQQLFEQSLQQDKLKTAAGYLLVLHAFEQEGFRVQEFGRLLGKASEQRDWDLCGELARFLMGIDGTGQTLAAALDEAGLRGVSNGTPGSAIVNGISGGHTPGSVTSRLSSGADSSNSHRQGRPSETNGTGAGDSTDYFSMGAYG